MHSPIFRQLAAVAGAELARHMTGWPWLCLSCAHCQVDEGVPAPQVIRALSDGRLTCALSLSLPCTGRPCEGFCPARDKRAQKALPSCVACDIMEAPNLTSPDRRLAIATQPAEALYTTINQTIGLAAHAVKALSILAGLQCPGSCEAPAVSLEPGSIVSLPFCFPRSNEVQNV